MRRAVPPRGLGGNMGQGTSPLWGAGVKPLALRSKYFRLWQSLGSPRGLNAPFRKRGHGDAFPLNQYHSPLGRGSKPLSCPSRGSVGRSIPSRSGSIFYAAIQIRFAGSWLHKKSPPFALTSFSLLAIRLKHFSFYRFHEVRTYTQPKVERAPYGVFAKFKP